MPNERTPEKTTRTIPPAHPPDSRKLRDGPVGFRPSRGSTTIQFRDLPPFVRSPESESRRGPIYIYDRLDEPSRGMLEENLAAAEGGEVAVKFATGMGEWSIWKPTPVNPTMERIDLRAIRQVVGRLNEGRAEAEKIRIVVDNTFATPYCQRPLEHGVDIIVHSLKDIGGFGTEMGGTVIGFGTYLLMPYRKDFGGVLSPKNAWPILVYGLPPLAARMVNQEKSAMQVAEFLLRQPKVRHVVYPGLANFAQREPAHHQMTTPDGSFAPGHMLYFELKGKNGDGKSAAEAAERFVDYIAEKSYTVTLAVSLRQIKALIENRFP
jgi:cystathionine beta-lyase/cystathionine gamma-synthase